MNIREEARDGAALVHLDGRLDSSTSASLEQVLPARVQEGGTTIVDLAGLRYVSSAGLRVFLKAAKAAKAKGSRLVLAAMSAEVREVFDISGFTALFTLAPSVDDALSAR